MAAAATPPAYLPPADRLAGSVSPIQSLADYHRLWFQAHHDPDAYWLSVTQRLIQWQTPPQEGLRGDFHSVKAGPLSWFADGVLNITESCLDRHAEKQGDKVAILWEGDEPGMTRRLTYRQLLAAVNRASHVLRNLGVKRGDRVIIYMGMVPEAAIAMLACARIGAIHSVVFGGFSAEALRDRIRDCDAEVVITQNEGLRGRRVIPLKAVVDTALEGEKAVHSVLVFKRTDNDVPMAAGRDHDWASAMAGVSDDFTAESMQAEDPLFILYTSGSTGRPKGVVHTCGGYLTYAAHSHQLVFDLRPDDVYACMADVGWITGHSYIVYGPLANGATTFMFESTPLCPDAGRYWQMVERYGITIFYTAPTAIRHLAAQGDEFVTRYDRSSLRVLGTVGEPINPEAWEWYHRVVGEGRCAVVDTWWQTETGGICIAPLANCTPTHPGSATLPMVGIEPVLLNDAGHEIRGPGQGRLCIKTPWPGQARTVWGDHARFVSTYFSTFEGYYFTGDGCRRDGAGYHWITGRVDDVLNISGHRMGTAEFESALVTVDAIAEAAVVGYPHPVKGQGVYAYVVLQPDAEISADLMGDLNPVLRDRIGAHAKLDRIQVIKGLPKTRSGKVMRRILRKIAEGQGDALGDISTLADPSVVASIKAAYEKEH